MKYPKEQQKRKHPITKKERDWFLNFLEDVGVLKLNGERKQ